MWDRIVEYFSTLEERPMERLALLVGGLLSLLADRGRNPPFTHAV